MAQEDEGSNLVKIDDFDGEIEEHWQEARGGKVLDVNGEEVGTVEELYVWEEPSTVHLLKVTGEERSVLLPVHAVTNVDEDGVKTEQGKATLLAAPEHDSEDVPGDEARRAAYAHFGYPDPLDLGGGS
jgi:sporulation protein YlmC with PRC-barrel domain